jgi:hypothetical protein
VATDSRATAGNWIASQTVKKVIEINSCLLGTMAGGAAVSHTQILDTTLDERGLKAKRLSFKAMHELMVVLPIGLPILACIPRYAVPPPRAETQTTDIGCGRIEDPLESRVFLQGHGVEHGEFIPVRALRLSS